MIFYVESTMGLPENWQRLTCGHLKSVNIKLQNKLFNG